VDVQITDYVTGKLLLFPEAEISYGDIIDWRKEEYPAPLNWNPSILRLGHKKLIVRCQMILIQNAKSTLKS
jgi:hypothetical protein